MSLSTSPNDLKNGRRILAIWCARLSVDRWRLSQGPEKGSNGTQEHTDGPTGGQDHGPLVLITETAHGPRIHAANRHARDAGARQGMMLADARAVCPQIQTAPADLAGDLAFLEKLAVWAQRWGPWSALDPPDGVLVDITAAAHLFGGEAAMCADLDAAVGAVLSHLEARGLADDTVVIFASDNGGTTASDNAPLRAGKGWLYEGGVRTPIMLSWPGRIATGRSDAYASSVDLAPTLLQACGVTPPAVMSGKDLLDADAPREVVYGETFSHDVADLDRPTKGLQSRWMIRGGWKLIAPRSRRGRSAELYDLSADPAERVDLAAKQPGRVEDMQRALDAWWRLDG